MRAGIRICAILIPALAAPNWSMANDEGLELFEKRIRPVLVEKCFECHSSGAKKIGGNLLLDSRAGVQKGGDSGAVIVPFDPAASLLSRAIHYSDDAAHMPPSGKLPDSVIADFDRWIALGAPDPRDETPSPAPEADWPKPSWDETFRKRLDWWSLRQVRPVDPPPVQDAGWSDLSIDRFILARLEEHGLMPALPADALTLIRRASLVLTGLPPTQEEIADFLADIENTSRESPHAHDSAKSIDAGPSTAAVEALIDRLLASPRFGERWARHWMDVVRFGETHGNEWNYEVHHAWRYRDYLTRAFNDDLPFDRFIVEHIAGDLAPEPRWNSKDKINESLIGTAFYRFGEVNHDDCIGLRSLGFDLADNQLDTLTKAFQATTVACARCHDHKLDAIGTRDYHALLGILRSSRMVSHTLDAPEVNAAPLARLRELKPKIRVEVAKAWRADVKKLSAYLLAAANSDPAASAASSDLEPARLEKWRQALAPETLPIEHLLAPWKGLVAATAGTNSGNNAQCSTAWTERAANYEREEQTRKEFNDREFTEYADFGRETPDWQIGGQGLTGLPGERGDFIVANDGDRAVAAVLPAGRFTHSLSDRSNGVLRSPVLPLGKAFISFRVMGERSSALRLVSNNCQLNYKNYRALISRDENWITFAPPADRDKLRTYAELMTMFDNPKFPDQLSALGGDTANYRLPWEKAAENPRSYFGVTRVVWHDQPEPPRAELGHLHELFALPAPNSLADFAERYVGRVGAAIDRWEAGQANDADVVWLNELTRMGLLEANIGAAPELKALVEAYRQTEQALTTPRVSPGIADWGPGFDQPILIRGDCEREGAPAPRGYLEALTPNVASIQAAGSGRLELAQRIASRENPLTARVFVNRVWRHMFGEGICRTVDDFGHVGDSPSHPELLDHLADRFVEEGWSLKRLVRRIALSRVFRQSSLPSARAKEVDPEGRWLQHYPARRMEAELVRDSILATSGRLDSSLFGPSIPPFRETENADRRLFPGPLDGAGRRSLYIKNTLMEAPRFLAVFDFPDGKSAHGRRDSTNTPAQALALMNDPFVWGQADVWAQRLIARPEEPISARVDSMFRSALSRPANARELGRFESAALQFAKSRNVRPEEISRALPVWRDLAHAMFNLKEFIRIP